MPIMAIFGWAEVCLRTAQSVKKGDYLKTEYKNQVLDPIIERIANHVYNNHSNLGIHFWVLLIFGLWIGGLTLYVIARGGVCKTGGDMEMPTLRKGILERLSIRYPRDNNNNNQQIITPNANFNLLDFISKLGYKSELCMNVRLLFIVLTLCILCLVLRKRTKAMWN